MADRKTKRKNKRGLVLMTAGLLILIGAIGITGFNFLDEKRADEQSTKTVAELAEQIPNYTIPSYASPTINQTDKQPAENDGPSSKPVADNTVSESAIDSKSTKIMEIDQHDYIGILDIPALKISLPIADDWSYPLLKLSPCRYAGSLLDNSMIIAGHNYRNHFGMLDQLQSGDSVIFTEVTGKVYRYQVVSIETLGPYASKEMKSGHWDLTLFTCTPGGSRRVTVRCERM